MKIVLSKLAFAALAFTATIAIVKSAKAQAAQAATTPEARPLAKPLPRDPIALGAG